MSVEWRRNAREEEKGEKRAGAPKDNDEEADVNLFGFALPQDITRETAGESTHILWAQAQDNFCVRVGVWYVHITVQRLFNQI